MDLLSEMLRDLRLESAVLSVAELRAPWGIGKNKVGGAPFHIVVEGRCLLETESGRIELGPGDLAVLPSGDPHLLLSDGDAPHTPFGQVLEANGINGTWRPGLRVERLQHLRFGGDGAITRIITGVFAFRDRRRNSLLEALPAVIHVRGRMGRGPAWLEGSLSLLIDELTSNRPGFQTIAERLADMLFVQSVRDHIANTTTNGSGWLHGLADPPVAHALSLMHGRPAATWTVASLASAVGLSRTVFASRFRAIVGKSVMDYLAAQRMHAAAGLLAASQANLAEIAHEVGYQSEISFSKAFRRWGGMPPGQYRREAKANGSAAG